MHEDILSSESDISASGLEDSNFYSYFVALNNM